MNRQMNTRMNTQMNREPLRAGSPNRLHCQVIQTKKKFTRNFFQFFEISSEFRFLWNISKAQRRLGSPRNGFGKFALNSNIWCKFLSLKFRELSGGLTLAVEHTVENLESQPTRIKILGDSGSSGALSDCSDRLAGSEHSWQQALIHKLPWKRLASIHRYRHCLNKLVNDQSQDC